MGVQVSGDRELAAALHRLAADLDDPSDLLTNAAELVRVASAAAAPRRSGNLAASIQIGEFRGSVATAAGGAGEVRVVATAPYSQYVHYGSIHNPAPVPFMDLGVARSQDAVQAVTDGGVDLAISRAGLVQ